MTLSPEIKFQNKSRASKKNWAKVDPEERSERMRRLAILKNKRMTGRQKKEQALKMVKARQNKNNG